MTRREALELLGLGVVATAVSKTASAQGLTFPQGAVIRTLFRDMAPTELAGGATLFHEHLSLPPDFGAKFGAATAAARAANGLPPAPARAGGPPAVTAPDPMREDQIVRALIAQADDVPLGAFGEIGSWDEMTPDERKVFRAVGKAHLATNLPIFTHTGIPGKAAIEQLNILEDAGVNPTRVAIGHLGNLVDPNVYVHKAICRRGAFVGFDRQGGNGDPTQVPLVMALIDAGFADNLLFAGDASRGYGRTLTSFVPKLKAAGASDDVLRRIMVDNPRRFLAFVPKRPRKSASRPRS